MIKKSQRIWVIFVGLFLALMAAFAVPKTEEKEAHAWDPDSGNYTINTLSDLQNFRDRVNGLNGYTASNFSGQTITLAADIDLSTVDNWTPIGNLDYRFNGTFNGNNHTISNMKIK